MKRRDFIKNILGGASALLTAPALLATLQTNKAFAERRASGPKSDLVDVKDPVAKSVGYIEDFAKSKTAKGNKCSTCSLYVKAADQNGKEAGTCAIFPKKFVYGNAYCNSWAKKTS